MSSLVPPSHHQSPAGYDGANATIWFVTKAMTHETSVAPRHKERMFLINRDLFLYRTIQNVKSKPGAAMYLCTYAVAALLLFPALNARRRTRAEPLSLCST